MHCEWLSPPLPLIIPSCPTALNLLSYSTLVCNLSVIFKIVFTDASEHVYWNTNKLLRHCTAVMQVNVLYHRKSNRVGGVYKESRYTLIILNAFTYKMLYAGFHHQTFRTQHILNSFLEITGKFSLYRLLNSLALLFYSSIQETQLPPMVIGPKMTPSWDLFILKWTEFSILLHLTANFENVVFQFVPIMYH